MLTSRMQDAAATPPDCAPSPSRFAAKLALVFLLAVAAPSRAQECLDYGQYLRWVNGLEMTSFAHAVAVDAGYAYVPLRVDGLIVIDVSDPADWHEVASLDGPAWPRDIAISGSHAYVAHALSGYSNSFAGIQVLDISDPLAPAVVAEIGTGGNANEIVLVADKAYVAAGEAGLQVVDISDPLMPRIVGTADTPGEAWAVSVADGMACVVDKDSELHVIDISAAADPRVVGSISTPGRASGTALSGSYGYVADRSGGLHVVDVSVPTTPEIVFTDETVFPHDVAVVGNYVYAHEFDRLTILDASNPLALERIGTSPSSPFAITDFTVEGNDVYLVYDRGFLHLLDVTKPRSVTTRSTVELPRTSQDVVVNGAFAYVADLSTNVQIVEVSDPSTPSSAGTVAVADVARGLVTSGNHVYVRSGIGIDVLDVSQAPEAQVVGSASLPSTVLSGALAIADEHLYVPGHGQGLFVIDVSDPATPQLVRTLDVPEAEAMAVDGSHAVVIDNRGDGLSWLDISNPSQPVLLGSVVLPDDARDVTLVGAYAYVGARLALYIVDGTDPMEPRLVGQHPLPYSATDVAVHGHVAYVSAWQAGVFAVDVTTPSAPAMLGYFNTTNAQGLTISQPRIFVADDDNLRIGSLHCDLLTPVFLAEFVAIAAPDGVQLRWQVSSPAEAARFAVRAQSATRAWDVAHTAVDAGLFAATDTSVDWSEHDSVLYQLLYRETDSRWILLGERRVRAGVAPPAVQLFPAAPNPFNPSTTLSFRLPSAVPVRLTIHRLDGRLVVELLDEYRPMGHNTVTWHGEDAAGRAVPSGVYVVRLVAEGTVRTRKMVMVQ